MPASLIHRSAWNWNSRKFAYTEFSEVRTLLIDSLRVFSEKAAIVCLFGARRLSQQSYSSFPEPPKRCLPVCTKVSHEECGLFWHIAPSADNKAALFTRVRGIGILGSSYPRSCISLP